MTQISTAWQHRLKSAQRDLISRCGGIERAAEITSFAKSNVGRWNNPTDPDLMPINAVLALELDAGVALVTAVMAGLNGRRLMEPDSEGAGPAAVFRHHAEAMRAAGDLMAAGAAAFADGKLTPAEMAIIDKAAGQVEATLSELRKAIGHGKAEGGQVAILKAVDR